MCVDLDGVQPSESAWTSCNDPVNHSVDTIRQNKPIIREWINETGLIMFNIYLVILHFLVCSALNRKDISSILKHNTQLWARFKKKTNFYSI